MDRRRSRELRQAQAAETESRLSAEVEPRLSAPKAHAVPKECAV